MLVSDGSTCIKYGMQYKPFVSQPKCSILDRLFRAATKALIPFGTCITWGFLKKDSGNEGNGMIQPKELPKIRKGTCDVYETLAPNPSVASYRVNF